MSHSSLTWLMTTLNPYHGRPAPPPRRRRSRAGVVALGAVACLAIPAAAAQAAPLSLEEAKTQAAQAVAPLAVERVVCVRQASSGRRDGRRRAVCIVAHPAPEGSICRSFVVIVSPPGEASAARPIRTSVGGLNVCMNRAASTEAGR